jgi:cell wall-associated NlpC family hydrolase
LDIAAIDGVPVSSSNFDAREIANDLQELDPSYRPNEIGTPWQISAPGYFTDADHQDHLHVGFKQAIDPDWQAPADVSAATADAPPRRPVRSAAAPAQRGCSRHAIRPAPASPLRRPPRRPRPPPLHPPPTHRGTLAFQAAAPAATARHGSQAFLPAATPAPPAPPAPPARRPRAPRHRPPRPPTSLPRRAAADLSGVADAYPGDDAPREQLAAWLAKQAEQRGLPPELPVMAALVESNLRNLDHGHADSVGFFQMRVGIWNQGKYAGYPDKPQLQAEWFLDEAEAVKNRRLAAGKPMDSTAYGEWIADVERPAAQYRGRYQLRLDEARGLLRGAGAEPASAPVPRAGGGAIRGGWWGGSGAVWWGGGGDGWSAGCAGVGVVGQRAVVLDEVGIADVKAGRIDPRVIAVLTKLSQEHKITVSCMCSDHSKFTAGGSISNHYYGRGLDIAAIDGVPVSSSNFDAREIANDLQELDPSYRPNEIGTPWQISAPGYFTDADHQDHLHVGFKQAIDPNGRPPPTSAPRPPTRRPPPTRPPRPPRPPARVLPPPPIRPPPTSPLRRPPRRRPTPAAAPAPTHRGTLAFQAAAPAATARHGSQAFLPAATPASAASPPPASTAPPAAPPAEVPAAPEPPAAPAEARAVDGAAAEAAASAPNGAAAGPRALAALEEAQKHMGTPYKWGGSTPATGFDCSGLVQWAYAKAGIQIPRVTDQQILASNGKEVGRDDLVPGDLVFFRDEGGYVYHVGMSLGGDRFLHAPRTGDVVKEASLDEPYFSGRFTGGRRFDTAPGAAATPAAPSAAPAAPVPAPAPAAASIPPAEVARAQAAVARDAAEVNRRDSALFKAIKYQETRHNASVQFLKAIDPSQVRKPWVAASVEAPADPPAAGGGSTPADPPIARDGDLPAYPGTMPPGRSSPSGSPPAPLGTGFRPSSPSWRPSSSPAYAT